MKDDALADIILRGLYNSTSVTKRDFPEEIARTHGVEDRVQIERVCDELNEMRLITDYCPIDDIIAKISGRGARAIQAISEGESVMAYVRQPSPPQTSSFYLYRNVSNSNITNYSSNVHQTVTVGSQVQEVLERMVEAVKADTNISDDQRADALADLETLQTEAGKPKPNFKVARYLLLGLGVIASVAESAKKLATAWGS